MFDNVISQSPFLSRTANDVFENIQGTSFRGDYSVLVFMRALLGRRLAPGERIQQFFRSARVSAEELKDHTPRQIIELFVDSSDIVPNNLIICDIRGSSDDNAAVIEMLQKELPKELDGFVENKKCQIYFQKSFNAILFSDPDRKTSILFVDRLTVKKLHILLFSIPVALPWYFGKDNKLTPDEMALVKSIGNPDVSEFEMAVAKIADSYDFRGATIRKLLAGFETRYERKRADDLEREIGRMINDINRLNEQIGELLRNKNEKDISLTGLRMRLNEGIKDEESEIMQYCLENKNIVVEDVNDTTFDFTCREYLDIFSEDMAEAAIMNDYCDCYTYTKFSKEDTAKLLRAIFVDRTIRVRFCAAYRFRLNGEVRARGAHDFSSAEYTTYMPNPHIQNYECLGNYTIYINRFLQSRNYVGAMEQCVASCQSLNWGDGAVMREFFQQFLNSKRNTLRCVELPDGSMVSPAKAVDWLNAQEAAHEQAQQAES